MELTSQKMRKLAPELDPLRIGTGWKKEDLDKVQVMIESTYGDSHPGSGHLNILVEEVRKGIEEEGGGYYDGEALLEEMDNYTPVEAEDAVSEEAEEEETADADSALTDVEIVTTDDGDYELVDQSGKVLISDEDVSNMGVSDIISMYFTRDGKYVIADTGSMLYDEDELPIGGNVLFDLEGNVKRSNDYESISYGGDNGWLCVHNKKTNQTVYLNSDLKTELDLGDAYGAAGDFKKCLRRQ